MSPLPHVSLYLSEHPKIPLLLSFFRCQFCQFYATMALSETAPATPPKAVFKVKNSGKFMPLLYPAWTGSAPLGEEISQRACFPLPRP